MDIKKMLEKEFGNYQILNYEEQNQEYEGMVIKNFSKKIRYRIAKKTPKKAGYFVAFWEKDQHFQNQPFSSRNSPDLLAISVIDGNKRGIFILPKQICIDKKILSNGIEKGKMAMRFYPTWCTNLNSTALHTQKWQVNYFTDYSK
ncbi:MepB family protein [Enterococcus sp. AZ126]|uniref:MepB family protein n=1 Tax=Enterococcus sp. AZ126 TaxID=2774635 RepID=UPI003F26F909